MRVTMAVRVIDRLFCSLKHDRVCHSKALLKGEANAELRKLLNIGRTDDGPESDILRLSDAELIAQVADQAKQLGIKIDLNYSFAQLPPATEPDSSE
jgi:hypothetical protein